MMQSAWWREAAISALPLVGYAGIGEWRRDAGFLQQRNEGHRAARAV
jgi:hypothetical protein